MFGELESLQNKRSITNERKRETKQVCGRESKSKRERESEREKAQLRKSNQGENHGSFSVGEI